MVKVETLSESGLSLNHAPGIYLPKTDSASLAFQLLPMYKLLDAPEHNVQDYVQDKRASIH